MCECNQHGVGREANHLEHTRLIAAYRDFLANGISVAEEAMGKCPVGNYGNGMPRSVGQLEIAAAQDRNAKDAAEPLAASESIRLPCRGNRLVRAAYQIFWQFARKRQSTDGGHARDAGYLPDRLNDAIAPSPPRLAARLLRWLEQASNDRARDIESGFVSAK